MDPTRPARGAVRRARAAASAQGARESGLGHLIELHGISNAGDALVAVALAGTLFFGVSSSEARGKVALYLVLTMIPFTVLAPVVGPLLDRVRRGRRLAIAATLVARGVLALSLARALSGTDPLTLYPDAFGLLILSKAYNVARSAVVPHLLPDGVSLVKANARLNLSGLLLAAAAARSAAASRPRSAREWTLRLASLAFFGAAAIILSLPGRVDTGDEGPAGMRTRFFLKRAALGSPVPATALAAAAALRRLNGFCTVFLAFVLRDDGGVGSITSGNVALGVVIGFAAVGGVVGTGLGGAAKARAPIFFGMLSMLVAIAVCVAGALFYGVLTLILVGLVVGMGQAVSKLGVDSLIQEDVPDSLRGSAFSLSESVLQLAWVLGGVVGIALPLRPALGLSVAAVACVLTLLWSARSARVGRLTRRRPASASAS